jgi:hypothetical protein
MIYLLAFSPTARAIGAFLVGAYFVGDWCWHYQAYPYLPPDIAWRYTNPYKLYVGIFLLCVGALGAAVSYWLIRRRHSKENEARGAASTP